MDYSKILQLLKDIGILDAIIGWATSESLNHFLSRTPLSKKNIEWQFLHCLQQAHLNACAALGWEYNDDAFCFIVQNSNISNFLDEGTLGKLLHQAVGHNVSSKDIQTWLYHFQVALADAEHSQLYRLVQIQHLSQSKGIPYLHRQYIKKFQAVQYQQNGYTLSLREMYLPNKYKLSRDFDDNVHSNILELIDAFMENNFDQWLCKNHITLPEQTTALIIYGHQCTGKSTLISKILYEHHLSELYPTQKIYVVNFSDRSFRHNDFTPRSICKYLSINIQEIENAVLIIDGLDESEWPSSIALNRIEYLINDLQEYKCKLIVTSRPNYFSTTKIRSSFDVFLQPFSINQALQWLDIYQSVIEIPDAKELSQQIATLSSDIRQVVLIPYIFQICVDRRVPLNHISEIAQLYDIIFCGNNAVFALTPYNPRPRILYTEWLLFKKTATAIAIDTFNSDDSTIHMDAIQQHIHVDKNKTDSITSEFLLYRKEDNIYSFAHRSIPDFLIAHNLFDLFNLHAEKHEFTALLIGLNSIIRHKRTLPVSIANNIEYFVRTNNYSTLEIPINFIKAFLSGTLHNRQTIQGPFADIKHSFHSQFVSVVRWVFSFIRPNFNHFNQYDFWNLLSDTEMNQFIEFTNLGTESLDCLNVCLFSNQILNSINLQGINLSGKNLTSTIARAAHFSGATLSGAYLLNCDFSLSCFDNARCDNADFSKSTLCSCSFKNTRLNGANFSNANLTNADLRGAKLSKCNFSGAIMSKVKILVGQMRDIFDFDEEFFKRHEIEVYKDDQLIPKQFLLDEYRTLWPASYAMRYSVGIDDSD